MISKILIKNKAPYTELTEFEPTEVNYIFGANGAGKTILSKIITDPTEFTDCELFWNSSQLEILTYNKEFVKRNFAQSKDIKGIFSLGMNSIEISTKINKLKSDADNINFLITNHKNILEKLTQDIVQLKEETSLKVWNNIKKKYEESFKPAYTGFMGSQLSFFEKCLNEKNNTSNLLSFEKLQDKCTKIFAKSIKKYDLFPHVDFFDVIDNEVSTILETIIVGKKDIKFGELIEKLKNSDWVKEGHELLKISSSVCPFCQQSINANLASEIESFFDETYELQKQELNTFHLNYKDYFLKKNSELENLYLLYEKYEGLIDFNIFNELIKKFTKRISENLFLIETKIKAPSKKIKLKSISEIVNQIEIVIKNFNTDITKNNTLVDNIKREKEILINEIWRFVVNEIRVDIDLYLRKTNGLSKGIVNLQEKLSKKNLDLKLCFEEIYDLETKISTVSTSVKEINRILTGFGFNNFQLAESTMGYYRVLREDGSEAKETLSEGEYNFITFLYFYYLIRGSFENNGIIKDKVIVIDDPISSLDSNVLFIVSNLVKIIRQNCLENVNGIKQLFVLTHNVYFHKEVTFLGSREKTSNKETFWVIKKLYKKSEIIKMSENPIKTTYELLWREIQDNEKTNPATIHNTLRRILEYYFNIIGGLKYEDCINKFEDEGKIICKSLVSWINDGSHFINDDLFIFDDNGGIEKYIVVFEEIFKKMGHHEHYKMMMKGKS